MHVRIDQAGYDPAPTGIDDTRRGPSKPTYSRRTADRRETARCDSEGFGN
jgi:hypothetical protein